MKARYLILIIFLSAPGLLLGTTWIVLPWKMHVEPDITVESIPYRIYQGGDLGITNVYKHKKLIYSIGEYISGSVIVSKNGEYLVIVNFNLLRMGDKVYLTDGNGNSHLKPEVYKGTAIKIYKTGILVNKLDYIDLSIDSSSLEKSSNEFYWGLKKQLLSNRPAYIKNNTLSIFTSDNNILSIDLSSGTFSQKEKYDSTFVEYYKQLLPKIRYKKMKFKMPENDFILPQLREGKQLGIKLAEYLKMKSTIRDSAILQIYVHTLLITRSGNCEICSVSLTFRKAITNEFSYGNDLNSELAEKVESWIKCQLFDSKLIPHYTDKYVFCDFLYLKNN
jgi:hypothetical protein